ncbi:MAG TPA: ABC transporter permease [Bryobacteraceae bacterium]|nr:ABC transporter permease [Bryobacteraceae bacterium]
MRLPRFLRRFFRRDDWDQERARELDAYLETEVQENLARGLDPDEARAAARRKLGNPTLIREEIYRMNSIGFFDALSQDLRYALRQLRRSPGFTAAAVLSLALGIGANTAIFSLLDQVLLRLLPVKEPQQLTSLEWRGFTNAANMGDGTVSHPFYKDIRDRNQVFDGVFGRFGVALSFGYQGQTERIPGELVTGNYFEVLGVPSAIGRTFTPEDDVLPGGHPLAVLSYDFWRDRFHSDPAVIGQKIIVNNYAFTIIGVSARGFDGVELGYSPKIRIPSAMKKELTGFFGDFWNLENRRATWIEMFARLKPNVTIEQARAALQPLFHSILEFEADQSALNGFRREEFFKSRLDVRPASQGRSLLRAQYKTPLGVLMAVVGIVLLIACANVANLMIARSATRRREIAVRVALGAGRRQLIRQAMVESLLLALVGGGLGVLLASWSVRLLLGFIPSGDGAVNLATTPDPRVLLFTLGVCLVTAMLFGLAPAFDSGRFELIPALKEQTTGGRSGLRRALVAAQVFLCVLLVAGAGLFVKSLVNLRSLDLGFQTERTLSFSADAMQNGYRKERARRFYHDLLDAVRAVPGVESAGLGSIRLLDDNDWTSPAGIEGYEAKRGENMQQHFNMVSPAYFATLGMKITAGRDFGPQDEAGPGVVIVNQAFVRRYFGEQNPLGRHLKLYESGRLKSPEIIGVVSDSKYDDLRADHPRQVFINFHQHNDPAGCTVYVKTHLDPKQMFAALRDTMRRIDPNVPMFGIRTLDEQVDRYLSSERLVASLATVFGVLAAVLAAVGLYGLLAFGVARRAREIGVRIALGASRPSVTWLVTREAVLLVSGASLLAIPAAIGLSRYLGTQLYNVSLGDPWIIVAAVLAMSAIAAAASYLPARRAARLDPMVALRQD